MHRSSHGSLLAYPNCSGRSQGGQSLSVIIRLPVAVSLTPNGPVIGTLSPELLKRVREDKEIDPKILALIRASGPK